MRAKGARFDRRTRAKILTCGRTSAKYLEAFEQLMGHATTCIPLLAQRFPPSLTEESRQLPPGVALEILRNQFANEGFLLF
jgi:hypothetical protein